MSVSPMPRRGGEPQQSAVERAKLLERRAADLALEIADEVIADLERVMVRCVEASCLAAIPAGIRDEMRRLAEGTAPKIDTMRSIRGRS